MRLLITLFLIIINTILYAADVTVQDTITIKCINNQTNIVVSKIETTQAALDQFVIFKQAMIDTKQLNDTSSTQAFPIRLHPNEILIAQAAFALAKDSSDYSCIPQAYSICDMR